MPGATCLRQPGIAQLDMGIFKDFKLSERFTVKFKWDVFNVFNHAMFAIDNGKALPAVRFGTLFATPDVGIGPQPDSRYRRAT